MSRLAHAWRAMEPDQRIASVAALGLLVTMFFPWYGLQSLNRKTGTISSHTINAFGDVSFVEAAVFLVAVAVVLMIIARVEGREFRLPGGDGTIVMVAGAWAAALIFYRVFDRPAGNGYPVGIEWGFFLAFVAAGALTYAGWRMRGMERPEPPASAPRPRRRAPSAGESRGREPQPPREQAARRAEAPAPAEQPKPPDDDPTVLVRSSTRPRPEAAPPVPARGRPAGTRPRYPPAPPGAREPAPEAEQLSFEDSPQRPE
jgi:type IV secretory pathway TrbD component